jgi:hypothetical protein
MAFPGPGAEIHYNEAGEPTGWDYPSYEPPEPDPYEESAADAAAEAAYFYAMDEEGASDDEACNFARYYVRHAKGRTETLEFFWRSWVETKEAKLT